MDKIEPERVAAWKLDLSIKIKQDEVNQMRKRNDPAESEEMQKLEAIIAVKKQELNQLCFSTGLEYGNWGLEQTEGVAAGNSNGEQVNPANTGHNHAVDAAQHANVNPAPTQGLEGLTDFLQTDSTMPVTGATGYDTFQTGYDDVMVTDSDPFASTDGPNGTNTPVAFAQNDPFLGVSYGTPARAVSEHSARNTGTPGPQHDVFGGGSRAASHAASEHNYDVGAKYLTEEEQAQVPGDVMDGVDLDDLDALKELQHMDDKYNDL